MDSYMQERWSAFQNDMLKEYHALNSMNDAIGALKGPAGVSNLTTQKSIKIDGSSALSDQSKQRLDS
jgi:hypothetical protein